MTEITNAEIFENIVRGLYTVGGRRTSQNFAVAVLDAIIKTLEEKYDFLKYVRLDTEVGSENIIHISPEINSIHLVRISKAVDAIIQVVYMDLKEKAGLYFIKEIKRHAGEAIISSLRDVGVDLELLQLQQHYLYRRGEKVKKNWCW